MLDGMSVKMTPADLQTMALDTIDTVEKVLTTQDL